MIDRDQALFDVRPVLTDIIRPERLRAYLSAAKKMKAAMVAEADFRSVA